MCSPPQVRSTAVTIYPLYGGEFERLRANDKKRYGSFVQLPVEASAERCTQFCCMCPRMELGHCQVPAPPFLTWNRYLHFITSDNRRVKSFLISRGQLEKLGFSPWRGLEGRGRRKTCPGVARAVPLRSKVDAVVEARRWGAGERRSDGPRKGSRTRNINTHSFHHFESRTNAHLSVLGVRMKTLHFIHYFTWLLSFPVALILHLGHGQAYWEASVLTVHISHLSSIT